LKGLQGAQLRRFFGNVLLLTSVSLLMRTVSVSFNVYLSNRVGAEALGLFSLLSSVYGFAVTLATSGINLATTRLIAESEGAPCGCPPSAILRCCVRYSLGFGLSAAILLLLSARFLGETVLDEARTVGSLRVLALPLPFIALSSCLNGYFTARRRVSRNALAQVLEQTVRILLTVLLLRFLLPRGIEYACLAMVLGDAVSEAVSFLILFLLHLQERQSLPHTGPSAPLLPADQGAVRHELRKIALPVAFSSYLRSGLLTVEHILIPIGLRKHGASHAAALASYGVIQNMALPVLLFPSVLLGSVAGLLIPELAEHRVQEDSAGIRKILSAVFGGTLPYAIGVAGILLCFSEELGLVLYGNAEAGRYLRLLAPLIPLMYLDSATDAMLKGLGEQLYCMLVNIADALLSVILVWTLLPVMGPQGYVLTLYLCELFNLSCSAARLFHVCRFRLRPVAWILRPLAATVLATRACSLLISQVPTLQVADRPRLALHLTVTALLYLALLLLTSGYRRRRLRRSSPFLR
jgi:stage V sporulation protein B